MSLYELYVDLLRTRNQRCALALADALRASRPLEAHLLDSFVREGTGPVTVDEGSWRGRTAWIGPQLPKITEAGQLWMDTAELIVMISVAREPPGADWHPEAIKRWTPLAGWLSLHPVAVWQHHAYLTTAHPSAPVATVHRILRDVEETAAVTRLTGPEAFGFADWMGKELPSQFLWQSVHATMGETFDRLWGASSKEWCEYPEPDNDEAIALSRQTLNLDPSEERDADQSPPPAQRMLYSCNDWSPEIGFRTAVHHEIGLLTSQPGAARYPR
jgi:hypothetical protein